MELPRLDGHALRRPRLLEHFDDLPALTLVRGPIGSGKTTLVAQWADEAWQAGETVRWLDGAVDGPGDVVDALAKEAGTSRPPGVSNAEALLALTQQLRALDRRCVVVIDSFDPLAEELGAPLMDLLRRCRQLHLILCVRERHDFVWDAVTGFGHQVIGMDDLALTIDELRAYAAARGVQVDAERAAEIVEATGGLAVFVRAGLQRGRSQALDPDETWWSWDNVRQFIADHVRRIVSAEDIGVIGVLAYLSDVDLDVVRRVLTSRYEPVLSAYQSVGIVERRQDGDGLYVRMPPVVGEVLRSMHDPLRDAELAEARDSVIAELERSGRVLAAVELARRVGRAEALFELIKEHWWDLMAEDPAILAEALLAVPVEISQERPLLMRYFAELLPDRLTGHEPPAELDIPADDEGLRELAADVDAVSHLSALMLGLMSARMRGDLPKAREAVRRGMVMATVLSENAHHELPVGIRRFFVQAGLVHLHDLDLEAAELAFRWAYGPVTTEAADVLRREAANKLAFVQALRGDHDGTRAWIERATALPEPTGWLAPLIESPRRLAVAILALDRLDRAEVQHQLTELAPTIATDELWFMELAVRAASALLWGGRHSALHDVRRARAGRADQLTPGSLAQSQLLAWEATLLISLGRGTEADALVSVPNDADRLRIVRARLLVLSDRSAEAQAVLASVTRTTHGLTRWRVEALLLSAQLHHGLGEEQVALTYLRKATRHREFLSLFLAVPRAVLDPWVGELPELGEILRALDARREDGLFPASVDVVTLTERERRLIELLPTLRSRDSIARTLFVSTNTVKTQLQTLYRKLGVTSREEAVTRAYELGLLR